MAFWQHKIDIKDFLRVEMFEIDGITYYFVEFSRNRRLHAFKKNCNIHVQNEGGGGWSKAQLENDGFPYDITYVYTFGHF